MTSELSESFPSNWRSVPFSDAVFFQEGPGIRNWQYRSAGIPFVNIRCLVDGRLDRQSMNCLDAEEVDNQYGHFLLDAGDYVVSSSGTIGRIAEVSQEDLPCMLNTSVIRMRPKTGSILDRRFLRYFLTSSLFQNQIESFATGSAQRNYGPMHLKMMWIVLPPLPEQRAIAHILGTLDDKIELNRRINETLEEMARALFKSWFVDFDPVRAKMDGRWRRGESLPGLPAEHYDLFPDLLDDSELGKVPEGWEIRPLGDFIEISSGGTPRTSVSDYWDGDIPWYTAKDAPGLSDVFVLATERSITQAGVDNSSTKVLPVGTTIITARGTVGRLACLGIPMAMNQTCYGIRGVEGYPDFFTYWNVRNTVSELQARTHGTIFDTITRETFRIAEAVQAATEVPRAFEYAVSPLMSRILSNLNESRTLTAQRDALLPKLLAGAVRVESTQTQGAARPEIESSRDMAGDDRRKVLY